MPERKPRQQQLALDISQPVLDNAAQSELLRQAYELLDNGEFLEAERAVKLVLASNPQRSRAVELLGEIYLQAKRYQELGDFLKPLEHQPWFPPQGHYYLGVADSQYGEQAVIKRFRDFLSASTGTLDRRMLSTRAHCSKYIATREARSRPKPTLKKQVSKPAAKPSPVPPPKLAPAAPAPVEVAPLEVQYAPFAAPVFEEGRQEATADFFLRREALALRLAQSFGDLLCLPTLEGVDAYMYQQDTVRKVLRQFKGRALLADEVGLGKTIEACLTLKEYWVRQMVRRALILTPPSLVAQWRGELTEKFGLSPAIPEGPDFRQDPSRFWKDETLVIASSALARMEPHASLLAGQHWDMVIVDEAHSLKNPQTAGWKLVNSLQKRFLLLLTATPVENNLLELYHLITLLKPGLLATEKDFRARFMPAGKSKVPKNPEDLRALLAEVMIRNTRAVADVKLPHRIAASVPVDPFPEERELYERISAFVAERHRRAGGKGILLSLLQREAGSSPQAVAKSLRRMLESDRLPSGEAKEVRAMLELAESVRETSKGEQFGAMLGRQSGKMVVFTEFVSTLELLAEVCRKEHARYSVFRGDLSRPEKEAAITRFRDEADVLLATGAGGEGRNLQFANTVVNFDLPWNPMRLEQRVGRVHRIGQTQDVFVFNFCQVGSVEEQLLRVLHDKVNLFELVVGEMDAILGALDDSRDFADLVFDLWVSTESSERENAFDELAQRILQARQQQTQAEELDRELFGRDFEV